MDTQTLPTLGHIVFYVRNLKQSLNFYHEIIGLNIVANVFNHKAAMLTGGSTHHELLLIEVGDAPSMPQGRRIGLYHVGWKIGDSINELKEMKSRLINNNIEISGLADHTVSKSIYCLDPDGNEIELYIDDPSINWKEDLSWTEQPVKPLSLD